MPAANTLRSIAFALFVLATFALGACGQRGPLYLPDERKAGSNDLKIDNRTPGTTNDEAAKRRPTNQQ
jgi:predicted small lipoprotein YifL